MSRYGLVYIIIMTREHKPRKAQDRSESIATALLSMDYLLPSRIFKPPSCVLSRYSLGRAATVGVRQRSSVNTAVRLGFASRTPGSVESRRSHSGSLAGAICAKDRREPEQTASWQLMNAARDIGSVAGKSVHDQTKRKVC